MPGGCPLVAHVECAVFGSGEATQEFAQRPNAIVQAFRVTQRRNALYVPRCHASAARFDVPVKRMLDQRAAYLGVFAHGPIAVGKCREDATGTKGRYNKEYPRDAIAKGKIFHGPTPRFGHRLSM
jgi:hypothetical protein